jgi:acyl-CoA dehydrogenase
MMPELRPEATDLLDRVKSFINDEVKPKEHVFHDQIKEGEDRWNQYPAVIDELKDKAKSVGLWNLFLPESEFGAGLTNYEYAHLAEQMGKSHIASEAMNCSAPDTGNMEVIARYGNEQHQEEWLQPLLDGKIRSAFGMTEPGTASSDATNMQATAELDGDDYVINGEKWWTSGAGDPRCKIIIFMCVTNPDNAKHQRHSMILVPMDTEGVEIKKMMHVFGYDDAPHGHAHMKFTNVRVPKENLLLGEGRGFEIAQGRLGPGRIHHCMRAIGVGEVALELMCKRGIDPDKVAFGKNN